LERLLFPDSTLLDGLPEIVAAQPWMRVRAKVFAHFQARVLRRIEESMVARKANSAERWAKSAREGVQLKQDAAALRAQHAGRIGEAPLIMN
jgi:hypothetical protein